MGAGCRHSTRGDWTPQPAPMPQFPPSQGIFGATRVEAQPRGGPEGPHLPPALSHCVRMVGGRGTTLNPPSSPQSCDHLELGVSGTRRAPGRRDSTQHSPITPQLILRVLWGSWWGDRGAKPPVCGWSPSHPPTATCSTPSPVWGGGGGSVIHQHLEPPRAPTLLTLDWGNGNKTPPNAQPPLPGAQGLPGAPHSLPAPRPWLGGSCEPTCVLRVPL